MAKKRVAWVDIAKYICIMFVMMSHMDSNTKAWMILYAPFFLNLFSFCSGYVHKPIESFREFFVKKIKQLFIPWLIYSTAHVLSAQVISFNEHRPLKEELYWNFMQIRGIGDEMWFVAALFVAFIPFFYLIKWYHSKPVDKKRTGLLIAVGFLLAFLSSAYSEFMDPTLLPWGSAALPWHLEYVLIAMFYMMLGYLFRISFEAKFDERNTNTACAALCLVYCLAIFAEHRYPIGNEILSLLCGYVIQLLSIAAVVALCKKIRPNRYILYIGQNSLLCFALHGKIYSLLRVIIVKLTGDFYWTMLSDVFAASVFTLLLTIVLSLIQIPPIYIINRYLPFTIGRPYKRAR